MVISSLTPSVLMLSVLHLHDVLNLMKKRLTVASMNSSKPVFILGSAHLCNSSLTLVLSVLLTKQYNAGHNHVKTGKQGSNCFA